MSQKAKNAFCVYKCTACQVAKTVMKTERKIVMDSIKHDDKFYRLPKRLFADEQFRNMTNAAKALYMILLDRRCLSEWNGDAWQNEYGVLLYFSR